MKQPSKLAELAIGRELLRSEAPHEPIGTAVRCIGGDLVEVLLPSGRKTAADVKLCIVKEKPT